MALDPVSAVVDIGLGIAKTIAGISDMNKRRKFEQSLSLLTNSQQNELNQKLLAANTQTDRLKILSESITQYAIQNQTAAAKNNIILYGVAGVMALGILITVVVTSKK